MARKKLKVAFPHMGTVYIVWASLIQAMGGEVVIPPYTSKKTLSIGTKYSPEAICLPYKLVLGNFIEAIENGADVLAMISSPGICRLGEYSKSAKNAIDNLGYKVQYFDLDLYKGKFKEIYNFLIEVTGNKNPLKLIKSIHLAVNKIFTLDRVEDVLSYYRAREKRSGDSEKAFKKGLNLIHSTLSITELKKAEKAVIDEIKKTEIDENKEVLNVDITGEIYMVLDSFSNQNLERELGRLGVQTRRSLTLGGWVKDAIMPAFLNKEISHVERAQKYAKPYLFRDIGGDALECISDVVYANEKGTDGIIHISPFTCMPEIMSQNIFPAMRENCEIPILPLIMDEQTGRAGYITRLEAFVDLMRRRKRNMKKADIFNS